MPRDAFQLVRFDREGVVMRRGEAEREPAAAPEA
jgi:hypothetical protein